MTKTFSSSDCAGRNARKICPRHWPPTPSSRHSASLARSAVTASSAGSSRMRLALVRTAGKPASGETCRAPMTANCPERLRAEIALGKNICARAAIENENAENKSIETLTRLNA